MPRTFLILCALAVCLGATAPWAQSRFSSAERGGPLPAPLPLFPADNWWNQDVSDAPIDPRSAQFIAFVNNGGSRRLHPDFGGYESPGSLGIYGFPFRAHSRAEHLRRRPRLERSDGHDFLRVACEVSRALGRTFGSPQTRPGAHRVS
jgi:hypothetical protein